jgi:hypothetical protein
LFVRKCDDYLHNLLDSGRNPIYAYLANLHVGQLVNRTKENLLVQKMQQYVTIFADEQKLDNYLLICPGRIR